MKKLSSALILCLLVLIMISTFMGSNGAAAVATEDTADFYRGKTIDMIVVGRPGGGMDTTGRLFVPYLEKYTSATFVVKNMPAGNVEGLNYLYNKAKRDGLSVAIGLGFIPIVAQLVGAAEAQYDLRKCYALYGIDNSTVMLVVSADSPYKSLNDMINSGKTFRHASTTRTASSRVFALTLLADLGIKIKDTVGFKHTADAALAIIRGEQDSTFAAPRHVLPYVQEGHLRPLAVVDQTRHPLFPDVPTIFEAANLTGTSKEWAEYLTSFTNIWRWALTTPDVPLDRLAFLRDAFAKADNDPEFVKKAKKANIQLGHLPGEETQKIVERLLGMDKEKVALLKSLMTQ